MDWDENPDQRIDVYTQALLKLSKREGEVLKLINEGKTTPEIAGKLYLSVRTVENHRYHICKKLGLRGQGALEKWVRQMKESTQ